ncbi:MAG TPA: SPOR domain-containing protein [Kofleriaceae bacterium]|nr:SPOR domain-containing protein [Kofleriaceae bacterium]
MPSREPAELYKDKIEVSLDGRQIFYLFFGGAVIVGLVFVVGVMVGRRVEARSHVDQARTQTARDPLAALDRLESSGMSFQGALMGSGATSDVERTIGEIEKARGGGKPAAKDSKPAKPAEPQIDLRPDPKPEPKPDAKVDGKIDGKTEAKADAKLEPKADKKPDKPKADDKPVVAEHDKPKSEKTEKTDKAEKSEKSDKADKTADKTDAKSETKKKDGEVAKSDEAKARFTLQLSSFQDKQEAESFLSSIKAAGFQAYVTEADVSGKGTFYRVRLGSYRSLEAANDAKAEVEKSLKKTASVMKL